MRSGKRNLMQIHTQTWEALTRFECESRKSAPQMLLGTHHLMSTVNEKKRAHFVRFVSFTVNFGIWNYFGLHQSDFNL